ncbi:helix-turn-helix domain-containing protein [Gemmatimonadota bacterium]
MSDRAILREIGRRLKRRRLERNLPQRRVAEIAGVARSTVSQMENGSPTSLLTFVQILRALEALDELDSLLPDPGISPLELARMKGRERRRASGNRPPEGQGDTPW